MEEREYTPWRRWLMKDKSPPGTHPDEHKEIVLTYLRIFLAVFWLRATAAHLVSRQWWNGRYLESWAKEQHDETLWFARSTLDWIGTNPGQLAVSISFFVLMLELAIGVCIAIDRGTTIALRVALVLNVIFVICGVVNPSVFYIALEMTYLSAVTDRAVGMKPMHSLNRIRNQAIAWYALAIIFIPFIRKLHPNEIIADPASTLSLTSFIIGDVLVYRWWKRYKVLRDFNNQTEE